MMLRLLFPALALLGVGCPRMNAEQWKDKYLQEVTYHYRTQQMKNSEIAAREMDIVNQKQYISVLMDRVKELEGKHEKTAAVFGTSPLVLCDLRKPVEGKVTAIASEIGMTILSIGSDSGIPRGGVLEVRRDGEFVAEVVVVRIEDTWSAAEVRGKSSDPRIADALALPSRFGWNRLGIDAVEAPDELLKHFGLKSGLVVVRVVDESPTRKAGLEPFDVLPELGAKAILKALEERKPLTVIRKGRETQLRADQ